MLLVTRYLLPDTCYLTLVTGTCFLVFPPASCYLFLVKPDTSYLILASQYMFFDNLYLIPLTMYLLPNIYNFILVTWNLLPKLVIHNFFLNTCHRKRYIGFFPHNAHYKLHIPDALYWQIPYFMIIFAAVTLTCKERYVLVRLTCKKCHAKSDTPRVTCQKWQF